jgi:Trk K+ transport system NAD-binding subunit
MKHIPPVRLPLRVPDGEIVFHPKGDSVLESGSVVVVVGRREQLDELEKLAAGKGRPAAS